MRWYLFCAKRVSNSLQKRGLYGIRFLSNHYISWSKLLGRLLWVIFVWYQRNSHYCVFISVFWVPQNSVFRSAGIWFLLQCVLTQISVRFSPFYTKGKTTFVCNFYFFFPTALFFTGNMITYLSNEQHGIITLILNVIEMFKPAYFSLSRNFFHSVKFRHNLGWKNAF